MKTKIISFFSLKGGVGKTTSCANIAVALGVKTYAFFGPTDDKKLIPQNENVIALKNNCNCSDRPCLWEKRSITCFELPCLKYDFHDIAKIILKD